MKSKLLHQRFSGNPSPPRSLLALKKTTGFSSWLPIIALVCVLFLSFVGLRPVIFFGEDATSNLQATTSDGDQLRQICFIALFIIIVIDGFAKGSIIQLFKIPFGLLVISIWCTLSILWAIDPEIATRRLAFTLIIILIISYTTNRLSYIQITNILFYSCAVLVIVDFLTVPLFSLAVHQTDGFEESLAGDWRGIHSHKNFAGVFCALSLIIFINHWRANSFNLSTIILIIAATFFMYMSRSKTSGGFIIIAMLGGVSICLFFKNSAFRLITSCVAALAALPLLFLAFQKSDDITALFDDPASFTGRSQIWPMLLNYSSDHFLLGSGYGSFWSIGDLSPVYSYGSGWLITFVKHGHNGFLDILVQTGFPGLLISIFYLVFYPLYQLLFRPLRDAESRWFLSSILLFGWLHNLLESSLLDRANPLWVIMVLVYCLLTKEMAPSDMSLRAPEHFRRPKFGASRFKPEAIETNTNEK